MVTSKDDSMQVDEVIDNDIIDPMEPCTSGYRPLLQRWDENVAKGVSDLINESMDQATQRVSVKRKSRPAPIVHFTITGNERLQDFQKKREETGEKEKKENQR